MSNLLLYLFPILISTTMSLDPQNPKPHLETATFATGCFWCTEAVFQRLEGVTGVVSGYTGGSVANPTYEEVCSGNTGHAEAAQITYDPAKISYDDLLYVFWRTHDPTTLNRQGNDVGTQYRSAIFYANAKEKAAAEKSLKETTVAKLWPNPIVTEIVPLKVFYKAESYHQNYFNDHPNQPYCVAVIDPKVRKFMKSFESKLKKQP
jgi:peptide-methionine (S)-S-oxide reductase